VLVGAALRFRWRGWLLIGAALVIAGGTSNWIDRVIAGKVVDFIVVGIGPLRTGVFNVADVAIMVGVTALAIGEVRARLLTAP
jgi:signal peptidase II